MTELLGSRKADCICGCGLFGTPKKKPAGHIRNCPCARCMGKRNRAKGDAKARQARKALGIAGVNSRHEEVWGGNLRVEVKAGAQVNPIYTRFKAAQAQSDAARAIGDNRPFAMVAMPDGTKDGLVIIRLSDVTAFVAAHLE